MGPGRKDVRSQGHTVGCGSARWLLLSSGSQTQSEEEAGVAGAGETDWGQGGDRAWLVTGVGELASHCQGSPQALPRGARGSWAGMKRPALAVAWREKGRDGTHRTPTVPSPGSTTPAVSRGCCYSVGRWVAAGRVPSTTTTRTPRRGSPNAELLGESSPCAGSPCPTSLF